MSYGNVSQPACVWKHQLVQDFFYLLFCSNTRGTVHTPRFQQSEYLYIRQLCHCVTVHATTVPPSNATWEWRMACSSVQKVRVFHRFFGLKGVIINEAGIKHPNVAWKILSTSSGSLKPPNDWVVPSPKAQQITIAFAQRSNVTSSKLDVFGLLNGCSGLVWVVRIPYRTQAANVLKTTQNW